MIYSYNNETTKYQVIIIYVIISIFIASGIIQLCDMYKANWSKKYQSTKHQSTKI